jgi:hypothetical protein
VLDGEVRFPEGQEVTVFAPVHRDSTSHSILDIAPVSVGAVLRPVGVDDDLLEEMLEGRS